MSRRSGRLQPDKPYRKLPIRRLLVAVNQRCGHRRGPRIFEMVAVLIDCFPRVQSGVLYLGDEAMGKLMKRHEKTAHRAKADLLESGLVRLSCCGPRSGGKILNQAGQPVAQATGYELDPSLFPEPRRASAAAPARPLSSPAEARVRAAGRQRIQEALDRLRSRAGP
jgi:hypothetical protein